MNREDNPNLCECYAVLDESDPRYEIWKQVSPVDVHMPLKHPAYVKNRNFPNLLFYVGDAERLTYRQKKLMAKLMAEKFKIPKAEVLHNLSSGAFHIRADNISVVICSLHVKCMM